MSESFFKLYLDAVSLLTTKPFWSVAAAKSRTVSFFADSAVCRSFAVCFGSVEAFAFLSTNDRSVARYSASTSICPDSSAGSTISRLPKLNLRSTV